MWSAYQSLKVYHQKPSSELEVTDSIAVYCLDKAVMWFGVTIENLLHERVEIGDGRDKRSEAKYELSDLLDPAFRVPRPLPKPKLRPAKSGTLTPAMQAALNGAVKRWEYVKPS